jgi:hypothetical protein
MTARFHIASKVGAPVAEQRAIFDQGWNTTYPDGTVVPVPAF